MALLRIGSVAFLLGLTAFLGLGRPEAPKTAVAGLQEYPFHHDRILGTSLDLIIVATRENDAIAAEDLALAEIERLRKVFSTYDPESEISRLNRSKGPFAASDELIAVLSEYEQWHTRSGGAFHGQLGELIQLWKDAERTGREPDAASLASIVRELAQPGWTIDPARRTVTRITNQTLNLNSLAKGYILQRAAQAVRTGVPGVSGGLINLGGDIRVWGEPVGGGAWNVGIQNPRETADNAAPLAAVSLTDAAIATSGDYQRGFTIGGRRYSHILDPRSGRPAAGAIAATVLAPDCTTANVLATTLCVLSPTDGLKLVASVPGAECLILSADGTRVTSPGLKLHDVERAIAIQAKKEEPKGDPWPEGFQVRLQVELPALKANKYRRPYTAIWIEDANGKAVRTLSVWGQAPKYLKDLFDWWKIGKGDTALIKAVTRATRGPGKYELTWDGKDDKGNPLPQGTYTVKVEVHREHGKHVVQSGKIACKDEAASITLEKNVETAATKVEYGKKK